MIQRKKRTDRNHIVYQITVKGKLYIGVTAKTQSTVDKSVRSRVAKHFYRAQTEGLNWLLCKALRTLDCKEDIEYAVLAVIRGKAAAHDYERELIRKMKPALNSDKRGA
jgi:hypothetical protein